METNQEIVTEEDLIAFIAEHMDEFVPEEDREDGYDYPEDHVTEDDIARENGFWVDEDGHWRELDEEDDW